MGNKPTRVLLAGLKNTGKTLLYTQLVGQPAPRVYVPTESSNESDVVLVGRGHKLHVTDVSGDFFYRRQWDAYYDRTDGVVFLIDASTLNKHMQEAATAFWMLMSDKRMSHVPVLVLVNKCDLLPASAKRDDVASLVRERLRLDVVRVQARVVPVSLAEKDSVAEALVWLEGQVAAASKAKARESE